MAPAGSFCGDKTATGCWFYLIIPSRHNLTSRGRASHRGIKNIHTLRPDSRAALTLASCRGAWGRAPRDSPGPSPIACAAGTASHNLL